MAEDREVLREVWQGRIPTAFTLSEENVAAMSQPEPFYLLLPRLSYVSVALDKVKKHFGPFLSRDNQEGDKDVWLDFEGTPLKWHLPLGVLFDQMCMFGTEPTMMRRRPPWNLTVHFGNFPDREILRCASKDAMESHFMSCVKEADQIKHGGKLISSMQKKDHNQLWQGLQNDKFDQFWAVNRKLMVEEEQDSGLFKHIPFRLYEEYDRAPIQKLIKPTRNVVDAAETTKRQTTLKDFLEDMFPDRVCDDLKVLSQGISPDLDTPLQWMSEHLSYPDNFLHICVR